MHLKITRKSCLYFFSFAVVTYIFRNIIELYIISSVTDFRKSELSDLLEHIRSLVRDEQSQDVVTLENLTQDDFLSTFVPEHNGKPLRTILLSTWRSGSTFTGGILSSVPNTLYYYEPLAYLEENTILPRVRGPPKNNVAKDLIRTLLRCDYHSIRDVLNLHSDYLAPQFYSSKKYYCGRDNNILRTAESISSVCRISPFQFVKLVRLHLNQSKSLLEDDSLNIKLIYLVRDPRGIFNSRSSIEFCQQSVELRDVSFLCHDLESEFYAAKRLITEFPTRFKVVRYEDLVENTMNVSRKLLSFLGFKMHPQVIKFIEFSQGLAPGEEEFWHAVQRHNSSMTAINWRRELSFDEVTKIQTSCAAPLKLWGYKLATSPSELRDFTPYLRHDQYDVEKVIKTPG